MIQFSSVEDKGSGSRSAREFDGPVPFRLAPVQVGNVYDVKIESMSRRGDSGVAKIAGLVVFVSGSKVGDSVEIRITKVGRGFALAEITDKIDPSKKDTQTGMSSDVNT